MIDLNLIMYAHVHVHCHMLCTCTCTIVEGFWCSLQDIESQGSDNVGLFRDGLGPGQGLGTQGSDHLRPVYQCQTLDRSSADSYWIGHAMHCHCTKEYYIVKDDIVHVHTYIYLFRFQVDRREIMSFQHLYMCIQTHSVLIILIFVHV